MSYGNGTASRILWTLIAALGLIAFSLLGAWAAERQRTDRELSDRVSTLERQMVAVQERIDRQYKDIDESLKQLLRNRER